MRQLLGFYNNKKEKETSAINNNIIISYLYFILRLRHVSEWVSEWSLFNGNSEIVHLYHDENKLIFSEMMMRFALY